MMRADWSISMDDARIFQNRAAATNAANSTKEEYNIVGVTVTWGIND